MEPAVSRRGSGVSTAAGATCFHELALGTVSHVIFSTPSFRLHYHAAGQATLSSRLLTLDPGSQHLHRTGRYERFLRNPRSPIAEESRPLSWESGECLVPEILSWPCARCWVQPV